MGPVEHTMTCSAAQSSAAATRVAESSATSRPAAPVPALAQPELRITARVAGPAARWRRLTWTGAAAAVLVVKTAAATVLSSPATSAMSRSLAFLMPAATPEARNPAAAVTLTASTRRWATPRSRASPA